MGKYLDYKVETWNRIHFKDDVDINKVIRELNSGIIPNDLCDDEFGFDYHENNIQNQDKFITSDENDGQSTIELYDEDGNNLWNNDFESEIERKNEQQSIINSLESLVGRRFNKDKLEKRLFQIFGQKITVEDVTKYDDDDDKSDYNLLFEVRDNIISGFFDVYYLPLRKEGYLGETMYITEVDYEFE